MRSLQSGVKSAQFDSKSVQSDVEMMCTSISLRATLSVLASGNQAQWTLWSRRRMAAALPFSLAMALCQRIHSLGKCMGFQAAKPRDSEYVSQASPIARRDSEDVSQASFIMRRISQDLSRRSAMYMRPDSERMPQTSCSVRVRVCQ